MKEMDKGQISSSSSKRQMSRRGSLADTDAKSDARRQSVEKPLLLEQNTKNNSPNQNDGPSMLLPFLFLISQSSSIIRRIGSALLGARLLLV